MITETEKIKEILNKVIFRVYLMFPFYGFIMERTRICLSTTVPTACVDSKGTMFINPDFIKQLNKDQLLFVFIHELHHLAMNHIARKGNREPKLWNIACDYVINFTVNNELTSRGISGVIPGICLDNTYSNMSSEQVYTDLLKHSTSENNPIFSYDLSTQPLEDDNEIEIRNTRIPLTEKERETKSRDWKKISIEAATNAKIQGNLPGYIEREVQGNCNPSVPWEKVLRNKLMDEYSNPTKWNFSFNMRNRRQTNQPYILPGNDWKKNKKPIVFALDTSGSLCDKELNKGLKEIEQIRKLFDLDILFLTFDTKIQNKTWIKANDKFIIPRILGGGGTDFTPIFRDIKNSKLEKSFVIVYTDGYGSFPEKPQNKVLWVCSTNQSIPWGDVSRIH